jgi:DMSO/TMAO reductase YedYZ molybdopterin-dependent catalytic subunit
MQGKPGLSRRQWLARGAAALGASVLAGCDRLNDSDWFPKVLETGEALSQTVHKAIGRRAMAQEFTEADLSPTFRGNGNTDPANAEYRAHVKSGFADWSLRIDGLVEQPQAFTLAQLRAMPARTQITRHDCVEGWSAIGQWTGVQLSQLLAQARPKPEARFAVFHCADSFGAGDDAVPYYESIDMDDAMHVQTILAYALNGRPLPVTNGAPLRLRVERQLGYKQAKYVMRIELAASLAAFGDGKGGYWEDHGGYAWYAGI